MKYWVLSRKVECMVKKTEDKNLNCKAYTLLGIQLVWITIAVVILEINFWNVSVRGSKLKIVLEDTVATFPPYLALFILIESFIRMRNCGEGMR